MSIFVKVLELSLRKGLTESTREAGTQAPLREFLGSQCPRKGFVLVLSGNLGVVEIKGFYEKDEGAVCKKGLVAVVVGVVPEAVAKGFTILMIGKSVDC